MKKALSVLILFALYAPTAFGGSFEGPLFMSNGHPLYVMLGSPSLTSAEPENSLDIDFSYSSTYVVTSNSNWYFGIDLETAITDIQLKQVIGKETEIGLDIPVVRYGPGFMDGGIETFHRAFGISEHYGRSNRPHNQFLFEITRNGQTVTRGKPGQTELGDIMAEVKKIVYRKNSSIVSAQIFLTIPTGDPDAGFGSGKTSGGAALLINSQVLNDVMLYLNGGVGLINSLKAYQTITLRNYYFGGLGFEWRYSSTIFWNAQTTIQSSPFSSTGLPLIDGPGMTASVGGRYRIAALSSIGMSVTEDPLSKGAPDIMMQIDYKHRF